MISRRWMLKLAVASLVLIFIAKMPCAGLTMGAPNPSVIGCTPDGQMINYGGTPSFNASVEDGGVGMPLYWDVFKLCGIESSIYENGGWGTVVTNVATGSLQNGTNTMPAAPGMLPGPGIYHVIWQITNGYDPLLDGASSCAPWAFAVPPSYSLKGVSGTTATYTFTLGGSAGTSVEYAVYGHSFGQVSKDSVVIPDDGNGTGSIAKDISVNYSERGPYYLTFIGTAGSSKSSFRLPGENGATVDFWTNPQSASGQHLVPTADITRVTTSTGGSIEPAYGTHYNLSLGDKL